MNPLRVQVGLLPLLASSSAPQFPVIFMPTGAVGRAERFCDLKKYNFKPVAAVSDAHKLKVLTSTQLNVRRPQNAGQ